MLRVEDGVTTVVGSKPGKIFRHGETPFDVEVGTRLTGSLQKSVGDFVR